MRNMFLNDLPGLRERVVKKKMVVKITIKIRHGFTFQSALFLSFLMCSCKSRKAADWYNKKSCTLSEGNSLLCVIISTH